MIKDIGAQIAELGFNRLVFFNAHGGQIGLLQTVARELRVICPSMSVLPCFLWHGIDELKELLPQTEVENGLHAALAETSLMLELAPELVGDERPFEGCNNPFQSRENEIPLGWSLEGAAPCAWLTEELSSSGVIGDSRESNEMLGKNLKKVLVMHWLTLFKSLMASNWPQTRSLKSSNSNK